MIGARDAERAQHAARERRLAGAQLAAQLTTRQGAPRAGGVPNRRAPSASVSSPLRVSQARWLGASRIHPAAQLGDDVAGDEAALPALRGRIARQRVHQHADARRQRAVAESARAARR